MIGSDIPINATQEEWYSPVLMEYCTKLFMIVSVLRKRQHNTRYKQEIAEAHIPSEPSPVASQREDQDAGGEHVRGDRTTTCGRVNPLLNVESSESRFVEASFFLFAYVEVFVLRERVQLEAGEQTN